MAHKDKTSAIPPPIGVADPAVAKILWAVRDKLEGKSGLTGDVSGLKDQLNRIIHGGSSGGGGVLGGYSPPPVVRPAAPKNLQAQGIFGAVILTIDAIPANAAYVEWFAADHDAIGDAQVVGTSDVPVFKNYVGDGRGRYYWARGVSYGAAKLKGPFNKTEGTYAEAAADPAYLKKILDGQIGQSQLAQDLAKPFDNLAKTTTYSVYARGNASYLVSAGFFDSDGNQVYGAQRSWNIVFIERTTGHTYANHYDLFGGDGAADDMADRIRGKSSEVTVVIYTFDEPSRHHSSDFVDQLVRCGATRDVLNNMQYRSAYILIGIPDIGEGNGIEHYAGGKASDPNASLEYHLQLYNNRPLAFSGQSAVVPVSAAVQEHTQSIDNFNVQWTLKAEAPSKDHSFVKVAGLGLAESPSGQSGVQSDLFFRADRVAFIDPADTNGGSARYPFEINDGKVYLDTALIRDATIDDAKIKSLGANKIFADSLSAISANLGTVRSGLLATGSPPNPRVAISSHGAYAIWAGRGAASDANASFYITQDGRLVIREVDVIDTLQIKGRAVTVPFQISSDTRYSDPTLRTNTWQNMITLHVNNPRNNTALLVINGIYDARDNDHSTALNVRLQRDGHTIFDQQVGQIDSGLIYGTYSIPVLDTGLSKGRDSTYTYDIYFAGSSPNYLHHRYQALSFNGFWR